MMRLGSNSLSCMLKGPSPSKKQLHVMPTPLCTVNIFALPFLAQDILPTGSAPLSSLGVCSGDTLWVLNAQLPQQQAQQQQQVGPRPSILCPCMNIYIHARMHAQRGMVIHEQQQHAGVHTA